MRILVRRKKRAPFRPARKRDRAITSRITPVPALVVGEEPAGAFLQRSPSVVTAILWCGDSPEYTRLIRSQDSERRATPTKYRRYRTTNLFPFFSAELIKTWIELFQITHVERRLQVCYFYTRERFKMRHLAEARFACFLPLRVTSLNCEFNHVQSCQAIASGRRCVGGASAKVAHLDLQS